VFARASWLIGPDDHTNNPDRFLIMVEKFRLALSYILPYNETVVIAQLHSAKMDLHQ
jgi:hypothetical protein